METGLKKSKINLLVIDRLNPDISLSLAGLESKGWIEVGLYSSLELDQITAFTHSAEVKVILVEPPPAESIQIISQLVQSFKGIPVIAVVDGDELELLDPIFQAGAFDYLVRTEISRLSLWRVLRPVIAQTANFTRIRNDIYKTEMETDLKNIERLTKPPASAITAQSFGLGPLKQLAPAIFAEFVRKYTDLLDQMLENTIHQTKPEIGEPLRMLAEQLGYLKCGPRDVVQVHQSALKAKIAQVNSVKAQSYIEEGRYLVLELMGYLVLFYRNYFSLDARYQDRPNIGS